MARQYTPHPYQLRAIQWLCEPVPGRALFLEPGLGKTSITLAALSVLLGRGHAKRALVVAPLRPTYLVWPAEARKWEDFRGLQVRNLHVLKPADRAATVAGPGQIDLINYDGLRWLVPLLAKGNPYDVVVFDESTKLKHTNTERFKTLKPLLPTFARRWLLTGTPAPRGLEDLFGQVYCGDLGERLGKFITHFRRTYFHELPQRGGYSLWTPKPGAQQTIEAKLSDFALTMQAEDYLQMPPLLVNDILVTLPAGARRTYEELERDFFAEVASGKVTAANAAVAAGKLRQIVGGQVYDASRTAHSVHDEKLRALADLIEEQSGSPLLVAVAFQHEVDAICQFLKQDLPYLGGGVSAARATQIADDWNAGKLPVLLAHPTSVAHGLNLQAGGHAVCWFSLTWNLEEYTQFNARVYRQGQERTVVIHHLLAEDTIDQRVAAVLADKDKRQRSIMEALK
jgi:SNF2 family DNA or RNA helicase